MKKLATFLLFISTSLVCAQNIQLEELITFKTKSVNDTGQILKHKNYSYFRTFKAGTQWKANDGSSIIVSNSKGIVLLLTSDISLGKRIIEEVKKKYKYTGKSSKNNLDFDYYSKDNNTILFSKMTNPDNGKLLYSITLL